MKKALMILLMAAFLGQGGYIVHREMAKPAITEVLKLTDTLKVINGVAWCTLDEVNDYTYRQFRENLRLVKAHGIETMHLTMYNPGGKIYAMWGMFDMMKAAIADGLVLHTHAQGMIASAAVPLFLLGEVRTMGEHGYIMIHSHNVKQSDYKTESYNAMTAAWTEAYIAILLERTTMSEEEARKYVDNAGDPSIQFWMNYDQSEARGFLTI